jgi:hypothetical protein
MLVKAVNDHRCDGDKVMGAPLCGTFHCAPLLGEMLLGVHARRDRGRLSVPRQAAQGIGAIASQLAPRFATIPLNHLNNTRSWQDA